MCETTEYLIYHLTDQIKQTKKEIKEHEKFKKWACERLSELEKEVHNLTTDNVCIRGDKIILKGKITELENK